MPLYHCANDDCDHEWEHPNGENPPICDWCGHTGYILELKTGLELFCEAYFGDEDE